MALFQAPLQAGISLISSDQYGKEISFGKATANSYLIEGEELSVLFDLAVDEPGFYGFILSRIHTPLMTIISHGHPDHIFHIDEFPEAWMHEEDMDFPLCSFGGASPIPSSIRLNYLKNGDILELGGRELRVIHIPGHTMGSIMVLDSLTGTLFSGDSVARRILYGVNRCPPLSEYCQSLKSLHEENVRHIYSAHDRADLGPQAPARILAALETRVPLCTCLWEYPGFSAMLHEVIGEETDPEHLDIAVAQSLVKKDGSCLQVGGSEKEKENV